MKKTNILLIAIAILLSGCQTCSDEPEAPPKQATACAMQPSATSVSLRYSVD